MYDLKSEEIKLIYSRLKASKTNLDTTDASFHEEVALLMSFINRFLNLDIEDLATLDFDRMRLIMQMIDLKAKLIREQRQHLERVQKIEERKAKLQAIPLETFRNAITKVSYLLLEFVAPSSMSKLMVKLNEVIAEVEANV